MTMRLTSMILAAALAAVHGASAQQPSRPTDAARSVTMPLNEYNRLVDLANRPPPSVAAC